MKSNVKSFKPAGYGDEYMRTSSRIRLERYTSLQQLSDQMVLIHRIGVEGGMAKIYMDLKKLLQKRMLISALARPTKDIQLVVKPSLKM